MLVTEPGHSATVLVAFAVSGGIPRPTSAGKVSSVPPPAIEFMTPAATEMSTTALRRWAEMAPACAVGMAASKGKGMCKAGNSARPPVRASAWETTLDFATRAFDPKDQTLRASIQLMEQGDTHCVHSRRTAHEQYGFDRSQHRAARNGHARYNGLAHQEDLPVQDPAG